MNKKANLQLTTTSFLLFLYAYTYPKEKSKRNDILSTTNI